jgi:Ser/Thr protein kinase RdoA (MazF antagonist)
MLAAPPEVRADVERRVAAELGATVRAWSRLSGGAQNRLFRLDTSAGRPLVAKLYAVDRWPRLESEYATLRLLNAQHMARVPQALVRNDALSYAVYSFEPGDVRPAAQLTRQDVEAIAAFTADLLRFGPNELGGELALATDACVSSAGPRRVIRARLGDFETVADAKLLSSIRARVEELLEKLGDESEQALSRQSWRLTTGDFGPQNMLFTRDGDLTVVDFEAAGWDDPAHAVMSFVAHATTEDLPPGLTEHFLGVFAELAHLTAQDKARYEQVGRLMDLEWVAVYASALSTNNVANKRSAVPGFSLATYIAQVIDKLERRLARAADGRGYRFPV